jgi:hypothetical protein
MLVSLLALSKVLENSLQSIGDHNLDPFLSFDYCLISFTIPSETASSIVFPFLFSLLVP